MKGVAVFTDGGVVGNATFDDMPAGGIKLKALFTELPPGDHGFHIHVNGDLRDEGCMGACSHYNKGPKRSHGGPPSAGGERHTGERHTVERHTGDLGNISKVDHTYSYKLADVSVLDLLGRTLIVHADPDDLGRGGEPDSLTTGHSGKRISCALIGRAKDCEDIVTKKTRKVRR